MGGTDQRTQHPVDVGNWTSIGYETVDMRRFSGDDGDGVFSGH